MTNTSPSLLWPDDAKQAARKTPPPSQPGDRKSARLRAGKKREVDDDGFETVQQGSATVQQTHVTPPRPTKPPEPNNPATKGNFFAPIAPTDDNSEPDWESDIDDDDIDPPPELQGDDPHSKAIVKLLKAHSIQARNKISSLRQYLRDEMERHSVDTMEAFQWEREQRERAIMSLREKNEKEIADRQAALMTIREEMAKDMAATRDANNELSATLGSGLDKLVENQSMFQTSTNGTLATIASTVSTITQSTTDSVAAAMTGVTTMMAREIGTIAETIARVEGDMAALRDIVTSARPTDMGTPTVPPEPGPTETPIPPTKIGGTTETPSDPAPAADEPNFELNGNLGSGLGRPAWAASARHRAALAARASGETLRLDSSASPFSTAPAGDTSGQQPPRQDAHQNNDQGARQEHKAQYQNSLGYAIATGYVKPTHHDEESSGGRIISPRNADRRRQAMLNKVSPLDIERLGDIHYHGGVEGFVPLTMTVVHRCGYTEINTADVITSYQTIIHVHEFVLGKWEDRYHNRGPQIDKILEKGLPTFPRLTSIDVESTVEFYDAFQKTSMIYLLALIPFDCISIKMGFEALCPPGLGLPRYGCIARVLMEVLPRLLPKTSTRVTSLVTMVRAESGNGYDLLWRILSLTVPGFDPTIQVNLPTWFDGDVFEFAHSFGLYYRLQAKKGVVSDDRTQSATFLNTFNEPLYADVVTTLTTCIENYSHGDDDGYLPANLCIMGLALQIHKHAQSRAQTAIPRVRRTIGWQDEWDVGTLIQGSPRVARADGTGRDRPFTRDSRGTRPSFRHGQYTPRSEVQGGGGRDDRRPPPGVQRGRFARPDRNRGEFRPDIVCDACRRTGHVAANCDVLAIALFIEKYKKGLPDDMKDKIETDWLARWKDRLGNPRKPRRVMKTYIDLLDISVDALDENMCWECWPEDDGPDDFVETA
jgi:hypothetical protein